MFRKVNAVERTRGIVVAAAFSVFALLSFAASASAALPDGRAIEMVSPFENSSVQHVDVLPFGRPSVDGNKIAYQVFGKLDSGQSNLRNTYIATRHEDEWTSKLLSPPGKTIGLTRCNTDSGAGCQLQDYPFAFFNDGISTTLAHVIQDHMTISLANAKYSSAEAARARKASAKSRASA